MKRYITTVTKIAALAGIIAAVTGCGSSNNNNGVYAPGVGGVAGTTIAFSAPSALMTASGRIQAGVFPTTISDWFNTRIPVGGATYGYPTCSSSMYASPYYPSPCQYGYGGGITWATYYAWAFTPIDPLSSGQVLLTGGVGIGAGAMHMNIRSTLVRSPSGFAMLDLYATPNPYGMVGQVALSGTLTVPIEFAQDKGFATGVRQIMIDLFPSGSITGAFNGGVALQLGNGQTALVEFDPVQTPF